MTYSDINPMDIDPETNRPYSNYSSPALDTSFHDGEREDNPMEEVWVEVGSFRVEHDFELYGCGAYTRYVICKIDPGADTAEINDWVADTFHATHCQHEYDCCGHYYASSARWSLCTRGKDVREGDDKLILVTQNWSQNV